MQVRESERKHACPIECGNCKALVNAAGAYSSCRLPRATGSGLAGLPPPACVAVHRHCRCGASLRTRRRAHLGAVGGNKLRELVDQALLHTHAPVGGWFPRAALVPFSTAGRRTATAASNAILPLSHQAFSRGVSLRSRRELLCVPTPPSTSGVLLCR
jgi:hypothetical protein